MDSNLLPYQKRVVDEFQDVKIRTNRLGEFILDNPIYFEQSKEEQEDMQIQYDAMCIYCDALERRIKRF